MTLVVLLVCAAVSGVLLLGVDHLLAWIGKSIYVQHRAMLPWILLASTMACLAYVPHYGLYARGQDRAIVAASVAALLLFPIFVMAFRPLWPALSVPLAMCGAQATHLLLKALAFLRRHTGRPATV